MLCPPASAAVTSLARSSNLGCLANSNTQRPEGSSLALGAAQTGRREADNASARFHTLFKGSSTLN